MRGAARAAAMTEEEAALEKLKGLAEKAAARRAATGQANKDKHAGEEAKRKAETGQAGKVKRAAAEAARKAATGQAGTAKRAAEQAARGAKKNRLQRLRRSKKRPRITQRWKSTSTEMAMPGITNACSPPPRRAPDLSSAPHLSSTAPRHCAPRNCAPRTSRSANRAAQLPPRNSRRAAAPTHLANYFMPNQ
jgi:hypothetical protein